MLFPLRKNFPPSKWKFHKYGTPFEPKVGRTHRRGASTGGGSDRTTRKRTYDVCASNQDRPNSGKYELYAAGVSVASTDGIITEREANQRWGSTSTCSACARVITLSLMEWREAGNSNPHAGGELKNRYFLLLFLRCRLGVSIKLFIQL